MEFSLQDLLFGSGIITVILAAAFYYFKALITATSPLKISKQQEYLSLASFFVICITILVASIYCLSNSFFSSVELWFNNLPEDKLWSLPCAIGLILTVILMKVYKLYKGVFDLGFVTFLSLALFLLLLPYEIVLILAVILLLFLFLEKKLKVYERYNGGFGFVVAVVATFLFLTLLLLLLQCLPPQEYSYWVMDTTVSYWVMDTTVTILFLFLFLTLLAFYFGRVYNNTPPFDVLLHLENGEKLEGKIVKTQDKFVEILSPNNYLFSWDDIIMGNTTEFIKFLKHEVIELIENAEIKKINDETITLADKNNNANLITIKLNKAEKKINLEIAGKAYEYILKEENGKSNIYDNTTHLVNLDKIIEVEFHQQPN